MNDKKTIPLSLTLTQSINVTPTLPQTHSPSTPYNHIQLNWLKERGLLENQLLPVHSVEQRRQQSLAKSLNKELWTQQYLQDPSPKKPKLPSVNQTASLYLRPHEGHIEEANALCSYAPTKQMKRRHKAFVSAQERGLLSSTIAVIIIICVVAYLTPPFPYKGLLLPSLALLSLVSQWIRFQLAVRAWSPEGRISQIKSQLAETILLLSQSQMVTKEQRETFLAWAQSKIHAKIESLYQDPTTPVDDLNLKEELLRLVMTNAQYTLKAHNNALWREEQERLQAQEQKRLLEKIREEEVRKQEEKRDKEREEQRKLVARQLEAKREKERKQQREEEEQKRQMQEFNEALSHAAASVKDNIHKSKQLLSQAPLFQSDPPSESFDEAIENTRQSLEQASKLSKHEWADASFKEFIDETHRLIDLLQKKREAFMVSYNQYLKEFERVERKAKSIEDCPSWLLQTSMNNLGASQQELKQLAFGSYLEEKGQLVLLE